MVAERQVLNGFERHGPDALDRDISGRRAQVIHDRIRSGKTIRREDVLIVQTFARIALFGGTSMLDVTFRRASIPAGDKKAYRVFLQLHGG